MNTKDKVLYGLVFDKTISFERMIMSSSPSRKLRDIGYRTTDIGLYITCPLIWNPEESSYLVYTDNLYILNRFMEEIADYIIYSKIVHYSELDQEDIYNIKECIIDGLHLQYTIVNNDTINIYHNRYMLNVIQSPNHEKPFVYPDNRRMHFSFFALQSSGYLNSMSTIIGQIYTIIDSFGIYGNDTVLGVDPRELVKSTIKMMSILSRLTEEMTSNEWDIDLSRDNISRIVDIATFMNGLLIYEGGDKYGELY